MEAGDAFPEARSRQGQPGDRGRGSGRPVTFRDPPPLDGEAERLRLEIARILVGAPTLPVDLPAFRLKLLDVAARGRGIDLVLGTGGPVARLRLEKASGADGLHRLRASNAEPARISVTVEEVHADASRLQNELRIMAERVRVAVTAEKWEAARDVAKALSKLPVGIPMGFFRQMVPGMADAQGLVRTGFQCNQDCGICWQGRDWGRYGPEQILAWIEDLSAAGAQRLIVSGGEPTLDSELERYVRHARGLGYREVTLETNAIQLARGGLAERLREAGMTGCFVSLHSGNEAVSDAITRAPGTFKRTVEGVRKLLEIGVPVVLNCVMTNEGLDELPGLPDFIDRTFGKSPKLQSLMLSAPADSFDQSLNASIVPDPEKMRRVLRPTIDRAFALGIAVRGLDGPCGPPLCAFGADRRVASLTPVPESIDFRMHLPACESCAVKSACFGVRRVQVERYGESCVAPIEDAP